MSVHDEAEKIIHTATVKASVTSGLSGTVPGTAGLDTPVLIGIHTQMIYDLAKLFNVSVTDQMLTTILGLGAGAWAGITGARWVASWLPIAGGFIGGGISALHTEGFGWIAYDYFENL